MNGGSVTGKKKSKAFCKKAAALLLAAALSLGGAVAAEGFAASAAELGISAKAYVLTEAETGRVLLALQEHERLPIASTTKIMTALLCLEQQNLDAPFAVDADAVRVEGSSMGLRPDDTVTLRDLCYGMLLPSGNDAANAASVRVAGSEEAFATLMNRRARALGMADTSFVTPSGLHNENHYSTAYDMSLLAREALQNEDFAAICGSKKAKLCFGNPPVTRFVSNHNKLLDYYEGCVGVKTGFTKKAGRCLVSAASRDGVTLICVTLNAPNDWQDHTALLDYGFAELKPVSLYPETRPIYAQVVGGEKDRIEVAAEQPVQAALSDEECARLTRQLLIPPFVYAPVKTGDTVGRFRYLLDGEEVASGPLKAMEPVGAQKAKGLRQRIKEQLGLSCAYRAYR